jgi:type IV secretory system VirB8-like protein
MPQSEIKAFPISSKLVDLEYVGFHELLEKENKIIRVSLAAVSVTVVLLGVGLFLMARQLAHRQVEVIRINDIGKADAVAYKSDYAPQAPETRYFLTQWAVDRYSRIGANVRNIYPRNYFFLDSSIAGELMEKDRREKAIVQFMNGTGEENDVLVNNVHITNLQNRPYTADLYLAKVFHSSALTESHRENWVVRVNFSVNPQQVRNELVPFNPLGLTISYFREDQAFN